MRAVFELTESQRAIWNMEQYAGGSIAMITGSILFCRDEYNPSEEEQEKAALSLFSKNEAFRTRITDHQGICLQTFIDEIPASIPVMRFRDLDEFHVFAQTEARKSMNNGECLCDMRLVETEKEYGLFLKIHHLIGDAWTISLIARQYSCALRSSDGPAAAFPYSDHIEAEKKYIASPRNTKDKDFFINSYARKGEKLLIEARPKKEFHAERITYTLGSETSDILKKWLEKHEISPFIFFMMVYAVYFSRTHMNLADFYFGTTLLNRYTEADRNTAGMFVNTLPVSIHVDSEQSFAQNLKELNISSTATLRHGRCSLDSILREIRHAYDQVDRLFDISINYLNAKIDSGNLHFTTYWYPNGMQTDALQIQMEDMDNTGLFHIHYDYRTACFTEKQIRRIHQAVGCIMNTVLKNDGLQIKDIPILSSAEKKDLLTRGNPQEWPFIPSSLGAWFHELAQKNAKHVIVEASDGTLTYEELDRLSDRAAAGLRARGVHCSDVIALKISRRKHLPVMLLGAVKAGAVFLPVDPELPADRIEYMLENSESVLTVDDAEADKMLGADISCTYEDIPGLDGLCYCIYTSGSTGIPKGVRITRRNIVNNIFWRLKTYPERNRRVICVTNISADTFYEDFFYSLYSGNTLCLVENRRNLDDIRRSVEAGGGNTMMTTPSFFNIITREIPMSVFAAVTLVGEACDADLARALVSNGVQLHNEYGPSECTICATHTILTDGDIHIGTPIDNATIYIVDQYLQPVPVGVTGELCIAGEPVGKGYIGLPEQNRERFVQDLNGHGLMYRTGDLAYWREDGNIALVGRTDGQVKIHGLRIELGEIEARFNEIPEVEQAAVTVQKSDAGQPFLCAFYTGKALDSGTIQEHLSRHLPRYMVPKVIRHLDSMPLTANGKINRRLFPHISFNENRQDTEYVAPITEEQKVLCKLAGDILRISPFGATHHFFNMGGDSLSAIAFVAQARHAGYQFSLQMLYDYPTIAKLTEVMQRAEIGPGLGNTPIKDEINQFISGNASAGDIKRSDPGNLFLTGATGFLGAHILRAFLTESDGDVWCLVRGKSEEESKARLQSKLNFYFGNSLDRFMNRIHIFCGELSKPLLGLDEERYQQLGKYVQTVIHAAANVQHYGVRHKLYEDNVTATANIANFCIEHGIRMVHCSTTSIAGEEQTGQPFKETDLDVNQKISNIYVQSKLEAEKQILEAATERGLKTNIMRIGNLTNRASDGVFQENYESNAFLRHVKAMILIGMIPDELLDEVVEFTPVDEAAEAIVVLVQYFSEKRNVFHIQNPHVVSIRTIVQEMKRNGYSIITSTQENFAKAMNSTADDAEKKFADEVLVNDLTDQGKLQIHFGNHVSSEVTERRLSALGFEWAEVDSDYFARYFAYFRSRGYLPAGGITS